MSSRNGDRIDSSHPAALSVREREVLALVARASSNRQIAGRLSITEGTVKRHLWNIFTKLNAVSRIDAVNKARSAGVISDRGSPRPGHSEEDLPMTTRTRATDPANGAAPYQALTASAASMPGAQMLQPGDVPWTDFPDGTGAQFKLLNVDLGSGGWTTIMRFPEGVRIPMHLHLGAVEIYTISGDWSYQEGRLTAGGYAYEPSGVIHEPDSETEVELFIVSRGSNLYFDAEGGFLMWLDAHMLYTVAKRNGAAAHLRHLDHLLVERSMPT